MPKFSWKTALTGAALVAAAGYAFAAELPPGGGPMQPYGQMRPYGQMQGGPMQGMPQQGGMMGPMNHMGMMGQMGPMHAQMMQGMQGRGGVGQGMHAAMNGQQPFGVRGVPTMPGQEAFGTIQEIVRMLEADPSTDWSKVNISALREHLVDMNEVTLRAKASEHMLDNGIEIAVTGAGRTLEAIKRMVPAHVHELTLIGWNAKTEDLPNGVKLTVMAKDASELTKLKALGFMGIMVQGAHHQIHHLMMAKGEMAVH